MNNLIPEHITTKAELFAFLKENKKTLIAQKKAIMKRADAVVYNTPMLNNEGVVTKASEVVKDNPTEIKVRAVINTTNFLDSHNDLHVKGIWSKSLKENKSLMHLQEHKMAFDKIISDGANLTAYTKEYNWTDLGYEYKGTTEALVFDSTITVKRNPFMFEQYKDGNVKNHSVGMYYVKLDLALNSDSKSDKEEKEVWDKYFPTIANKEEAVSSGFFWVVKEAKLIEGSAVPIGSNTATPTLENTEAVKTLQAEPSPDTQTFTEILKQIKH